jgi:hypothetical protein
MHKALPLSSSRTLVTPYCKRIRPGRRTTRGRSSPYCSPLCSVSRRPIWAGTRSDNLLVGLGTPRGRNADNYYYYYYCRRFGPARTVNRPVNLLLRVPAQMG